MKGNAVPAMKVTISAAMRARDVSRPRPEQLDDAEAAEASALKKAAEETKRGAGRGTGGG